MGGVQLSLIELLEEEWKEHEVVVVVLQQVLVNFIIKFVDFVKFFDEMS